MDYLRRIREEREHERGEPKTPSRYEQHQKVFNGIPSEQQIHIRFAWFLPFESIIEIDPIGDGLFNGVHLYCRYSGPRGPYEDRGPVAFGPHGWLPPARRKTILPMDPTTSQDARDKQDPAQAGESSGGKIRASDQ